MTPAIQHQNFKSPHQRVRVEFSLALNNRTGKYFVCRDMIASTADLISKVSYWRINTNKTPTGLSARILGRLMTDEVSLRCHLGARDALSTRMRPAEPMVFTDPLQVLLYRLRSTDLVVCHDMGPLTHPRFYAAGVEQIYKRVFSEISAAKPIMAFVSLSSQLQYERLFGKAYSSAHVIHLPVRAEIAGGVEEALPDVGSLFFLTVGAVGFRKNQIGSIDAFERSGLADQGVQYLISGGPEPGYEAVVSRASSARNVHLLGYVNDAQLRWLYSNASGFVLPSLLEGFGVPAAEAILRGLMPLVGSGGALHEVTGDSAVLVDPEDVDSIAAGMRALISMPFEERQVRLRALSDHIAPYNANRARADWRNAFHVCLHAHELLRAAATASDSAR